MENQETKPTNPTIQEGWTLRDEFASSAMRAIISNADTMREITKAWSNTKYSERPCFAECIAKLSFQYSDAMLKQRSL